MLTHLPLTAAVATLGADLLSPRARQQVTWSRQAAVQLFTYELSAWWGARGMVTAWQP